MLICFCEASEIGVTKFRWVGDGPAVEADTRDANSQPHCVIPDLLIKLISGTIFPKYFPIHGEISEKEEEVDREITHFKFGYMIHLLSSL
jgi:hypothetical protein